MTLVADGSLFLAIFVAFFAGVISFLSPCVLPLVPGYLSVITGMSDIQNKKITKSKAVLATFLFILGFSLVFVSIGMFFGSLGGWLLSNIQILERIFGFVIILLGFSYLGIINIFNKEYKFKFRSKQSLFGAFILGFVFSLGWTPCIGPTLAAVQSLAFSEGTLYRGAILSAFYSIGLGIPFIALTILFEKSLTTVKWLRQKQKLFISIGGILLIILGLLLVTGLWNLVSIELRVFMAGFSPLL
jgi:cytochrome c-type biogenesis protein